MITVTGATGHLGNVLIRELLEKGEKIRALILPHEKVDSLSGLAIEKVPGDVCNPYSLEKAFEDAKIVFHCAGVISILPGKWKWLYRVNVQGTKNVIDACIKKKVKRLIYTSSIHALAELPQGELIDESTSFNPDQVLGDYSKSKALATLEVLKGIKQGLDAVIICPSGIIGPYDYRLSEMGRLVLNYSQGKIKAYIDGTYDFVDVRDVAKGHILASEKGKKGECYILSGNQIKVYELFQILEKLSGIKAPAFKMPYQLAKIAAFFNVLFCTIVKNQPLFTPFSIKVLKSNSLISNRKAVNELGYSSRSLNKSISDTFQWFKEREEIRV